MDTLKAPPASPLKPAMNDGVEMIRGKKLRFAYASGAQPLPGYTIKRGIGAGGFGEVYFAISDAGKEVALKRIQRNLDIELRGVRQCLNLKHVNLISLWDICTTESGESWVVMEYVPGESLREVIERHAHGMPNDEIERWFCSVVAGVGYLHNNGIVHRDLKPGNIFYDADEDVVKIGDYGLSKFISCSQRSGQTESVGTFHYMAPEIGKGVYGKEIDVYALGIILYEMLCGKLPFDGESSQEIIMKHLTATPNLDPVPAPFRTLIFRALAKDPEERYHSMEELLADFPGTGKGTFGNMRSGRDGSRREFIPPRSGGAAKSPPVVEGPVIPSGERETYYIGDDAEVVFAESPHVVHAQFAGPTAAKALLPAGTAKLPEEPIARALKSSYLSLVDQWNRSQLGTTAKTCILIAIAITLIVNSAWIVPVGVALAMIYLPYLVIRAWVITPRTARTRPIRISRRVIESQLRQSLLERPAQQRFGDLTGAFLRSTVVCAVFGLLTATFFADQSTVSAWSYGTWVTLTALVASWSVLICGKLWETSTGENFARRFWMLGIGLMIAVSSFGIGRALEIDFGRLAAPARVDFLDSSFLDSLKDEASQPRLAMFLLFFGSVFFLLRWWRQSDPVRKTRLSLWSVGLCWLAALLMAEALEFPLVAGCLAIVAASIATQLAAPWINQHERRQVRLAVGNQI
jgi:serine/threonine protein kinase